MKPPSAQPPVGFWKRMRQKPSCAPKTRRQPTRLYPKYRVVIPSVATAGSEAEGPALPVLGTPTLICSKLPALESEPGRAAIAVQDPARQEDSAPAKAQARDQAWAWGQARDRCRD